MVGQAVELMADGNVKWMGAARLHVTHFPNPRKHAWKPLGMRQILKQIVGMAVERNDSYVVAMFIFGNVAERCGMKWAEMYEWSIGNVADEFHGSNMDLKNNIMFIKNESQDVLVYILSDETQSLK